MFPSVRSIIDPFLGTGTTAWVAKKMGLKAIGIEIEERYAEIAARRMAQAVLPLDATGSMDAGLRSLLR